MNIRNFLAVVFAGLSCIFAGCGRSPVKPDENGTVSVFNVSPTQGAAGSLVQLTGLRFSEERLAELELWIGGELTVFGICGDVWTAALPLFLDETGWPRPPDQPQSVELRENDTVVAEAMQKVTITELPPAPGTTAAVRSELDQISQGFAELLNSFGGGNDYSPAVAAASIAALDALINEGDYSLAAVLDGTSPLLEGEPVDLELVDALLSISGALEYMEALNEFINGSEQENGLRAGIHALSAGGITPQSLPVTDKTLAAGMQIYVIIDDLSAAFFAPNARAWARVTALLAISRLKLPHATIVGAFLTLTDFVMGSVVPGLLPARIDEFELTLDENTIEENELTSSTVQMTAVNAPPVITVTEVIQTVVTALGLRSSVDTGTFSGALYELAKSTLNCFNSLLSDYISHAGLDPIDEFSIPNMTWGPVEIRNPDLVELVTYDPNIVVVDEQAMEWRGVERGLSTVGARTRGAGQRSNMLPLPYRVFYHGGAFGNDSAQSNASIRVGEGGDIVVTITGLPEGVPADVNVHGPEYEQSVSASTTLEHLRCGDYLIFASDVRDDEGTEYSPTPDHENQTVVLGNRDVVEVTVVYQSRYGDLQLVITGLPPGVAGDVIISGLDYERQFSESQLIENLVTGTYTIEARAVVTGDSRFEPIPGTQTVEVQSWDAAVAEVVYHEEDGDTPVGFVYIPPGTFTMGSPINEPGGWGGSETQHQVTLTRGFFMSKYEVTEQWWYQVMGGTPTTSQLPKNYVSWDLAVQFCNALSVQEGLTPAYAIHGPNGNVTWNQDANGYRLPTDAEREYACRATTTRAFNNNTNCLSADTEANYDGNFPLTGCPTGVYRGARTEVGSFPANQWGLYDMHGNLWEWVWCGWREYTSDAQQDPVTSPDPGAYRVCRGGSYDYGALDLRSANRSFAEPYYGNRRLGFRPVRTVFESP